MIRQWRLFSSVVGRRSALKYAGLGLMAAVISACGGKEAGPRPTVAMRAIEAFAKGTWMVAASNGRTSQLTIDEGTWTMTPGVFDSLTARGEYALADGRLQVTRRYSDEDRKKFSGVVDETYIGTDIPQQVPDSGSAVVGWSFETKSQTCPVTWDGKTLQISGHDWYGNTVIVDASRV
jgi:hypothetical protein